jgi:hypothetical protein
MSALRQTTGGLGRTGTRDIGLPKALAAGAAMLPSRGEGGHESDSFFDNAPNQ